MLSPRPGCHPRRQRIVLTGYPFPDVEQPLEVEYPFSGEENIPSHSPIRVTDNEGERMNLHSLRESNIHIRFCIRAVSSAFLSREKRSTISGNPNAGWGVHASRPCEYACRLHAPLGLVAYPNASETNARGS